MLNKQLIKTLSNNKLVVYYLMSSILHMLLYRTLSVSILGYPKIGSIILNLSGITIQYLELITYFISLLILWAFTTHVVMFVLPKYFYKVSYLILKRIINLIQKLLDKARRGMRGERPHNLEIIQENYIVENEYVEFMITNPDLLEVKEALYHVYELISSTDVFYKITDEKVMMVNRVDGEDETSLHENVFIDSSSEFNIYWDQIKDIIHAN